MGDTVPNHGYVDLSLVGDDGSGVTSVVRCYTDLSTCCSGSQGQHRGDWYFPDGSRLVVPQTNDDIYETRGAQIVDLFRVNNANSPVGIYRCDKLFIVMIMITTQRETQSMWDSILPVEVCCQLQSTVVY